jgi:hypothetical protein
VPFLGEGTCRDRIVVEIVKRKANAWKGHFWPLIKGHAAVVFHPRLAQPRVYGPFAAEYEMPVRGRDDRGAGYLGRLGGAGLTLTSWGVVPAWGSVERVEIFVRHVQHIRWYTEGCASY